ncbi:hypothetical protein C789_1573 [Microcystis aeruginosa FACHB-905 = DIANCHI905]|nr:hypothetical protein C789_1573 [Microcystis aeruginosa FACHB-905 = DIANCHI905]
MRLGIAVKILNYYLVAGKLMQYRFEMIFLSNAGRTLSRKVLRGLEELGHLLYNRFIAGAAHTNLENPIAYSFYHWAVPINLKPY